MIVNRLVIFDISNEEANDFCFSPRANIIYSADNTSGKSCLLKSLYYTLGLQIKNFASGWNYKEMAFKIYYSHNESEGYILRHKDTFWVNGVEHPLSERDYSEWLSDILNVKIKLPTKQDTTPQKVVASAILNLFYIDQDSSWDKTPYKNTINLAWYDSKSIPKAVFEHVLGIKSSLNIDLTEKISELGKQKTNIDNQLHVLISLREEFVAKETSSEFDEEKIKEGIKKYLQCANELQKIIGRYKSKIYSEQVKLNTFEEELRDFREILLYNERTYTEYSTECPKCHSILTDEQSRERIKITNNILDLKISIVEIEKNINKSKKKIQEFLEQKIDIEKEYKTLLSVAQTKQGELTLEQHLHNKSKEMTRSKYYEIKTNLSEHSIDLEAKIKKLESDSKKLLASQARKRDKIESDYKQLIFNHSLLFNTVTLDSKFLEFKQINESGAVKNQTFLALYMVYSKILINHSAVELPFVLDSIVKDELDSEILKKSYKLVDDVLLASDRQTFFAILDDKMELIGRDYHKIKVDNSSKLLSKAQYAKLVGELTMTSSPSRSDDVSQVTEEH